MHVVGKTEDGRQVIGGLFKMHDEQGLPLSLSLMFLHKAGHVPDLGGFLNDALDHGWSYNSTIPRIREAVIDISGKAEWLIIEPKLEQTFELRCLREWNTRQLSTERTP